MRPLLPSSGQTGPASPLQQAVAAMRGALLAVALFSLVINVLMLTGPIFMLQVYDRVLASGSVPTLGVLLGLVIGLYAVYGVLELIRSRVLVRIGRALDHKLAGPAFLAHVLGPIRSGPRGENLYPLRELDTLRGFLGGPGPAAICDLPWMPVYLLIVFLLHPVLGVIATIGGIGICLLAAGNEIMSRRRAKAALQAGSQRHQLADSARRNAEIVHALGMEDRLSARFRAANEAHLVASARVSDGVQGFGAVTKAFRLLLQSVMLAGGAWLAIQGVITPGVMIAASIISARALAPIEQAVGHWRAFIQAREANRRLATLLDMAEARPHTTLPPPHRQLDVEGIVVVPPGSDRPTLAGIRFQVEAGTIVGVVGGSGAGKSTLSRALVGVWAPVQGAVRLDGAALDQYAPEDLGRYVGYLPQDVELFGGTVAENISRFEPDADPQAIVAAGKAAGVHDLVVNLPEGYDTQIGEAGASLSAGQRQRIGLARALYRDPFLLVLDEPNSSLDKEGEDQLVQALLAARQRGAVVILVAHRLSAREIMDQVLVLEAGRMRAFGPREQVMAQLASGQPGLRVVSPGQQR